MKLKAFDVYDANSSFGEFDECSSDGLVIWYRPDLASDVLVNTLIHEIVHAILYISGITHVIKDADTEEAIVRAMEYMLLPALNKLGKSLQKFISTPQEDN